MIVLIELGLYFLIGFAVTVLLARGNPDDGTYGWALAMTVLIFLWPVLLVLSGGSYLIVFPGKLVGFVARRLP